MDRPGDVGRKIDAHLKSAWGRTFLCTIQEVRESATAALMGIRVHLQRQPPMSPAEALYQRKRCEDVRNQIVQLYARGDKRHAHALHKIFASYRRRLDEALGVDQADDGPPLTLEWPYDDADPRSPSAEE
jgi:hypothetical protein